MNAGRARFALLVAVAPALLALVVGALGPGGAEGRFRAALAGLVLAGALSAFAGTRSWRSVVLLVAGGAGVGAVLLAKGAPLSGAAAGWALLVTTALAALGLAALGRAVGAGRVGSGAVALAVLVTGLTGLFWADPLAERLPRERRWALRQAVLHLDAATALAYDAAGFDRLLDPAIYAEVPLAASLLERPRASTTAAAWGALALVALVGAWAVERCSGRAHSSA